MPLADGAVRCVVVTGDQALAASLRDVVDGLPGVELAGTARAATVSAGRLPPCDVVLVADEPARPATALVRELAVARPGLPAVVLTPAAALEVYRDALTAGARGVVALPPSPAALAGAIADAHRLGAGAREDRRRGAALAVTAGKGGVGVTAVALALARLGDGLLIDGAGAHAGLAALLGCEPERSLEDLTGLGGGLGADALESVAVAHPSGLRLVAGLSDPRLAGALPYGFGASLVREARRARLTVIDAGVAGAPLGADLLGAADRVVLVVTPDAHCVAAARAAVTSLARDGIGADGMVAVLNRWSRRAELSPRGIERALGMPIGAVVRDEPRTLGSLANGRAELARWPGRSSLRRLSALLQDVA
jgi:pilus assembly protein CpaE